MLFITYFKLVLDQSVTKFIGWREQFIKTSEIFGSIKIRSDYWFSCVCVNGRERYDDFIFTENFIEKISLLEIASDISSKTNQCDWYDVTTCAISSSFSKIAKNHIFSYSHSQVATNQPIIRVLCVLTPIFLVLLGVK